MVEPYVGVSTRGAPRMPVVDLQRLVAAAAARGLPVALHAIGDAAVRASLDAFAAAQGEFGAPPSPHRIEHIEVLHPDDAGRFAALGVVASMQPYHANPGGASPDDGVWSRNLGPERLARSFPWRTLLDAGATLAFGSDWPVMSADPLAGVAVALTRRDAHGLPASGWNAHQAITWDEAVAAYTAAAALACGWPAGLGTLAVGAPADLVILAPGVGPESPASLWPPATGPDARVRWVVVGGEVSQRD
jgi:predicted amidohydrolase YtcJ